MLGLEQRPAEDAPAPDQMLVEQKGDELLYVLNVEFVYDAVDRLFQGDPRDALEVLGGLVGGGLQEQLLQAVGRDVRAAEAEHFDHLKEFILFFCQS